MMAKKMSMAPKLKGLSFKGMGSPGDGKPPKSPGVAHPPPPPDEASTPASHVAAVKEVISPPYPISPVVSNVSTNIDLALERLSASNRDSEDNDSIMGMSTEGDLDQFSPHSEDAGDETGGDTDDEDCMNIGDIGGGDGASSDEESDDDYYKQDYYALARQVESGFGDCMSDIMGDEKAHRRVSSQEVRNLTHPDTPEIGMRRKVHEHEEGGDYAEFYVDAANPLELEAELPRAGRSKETKEGNSGNGDMPVLPEDAEFREQDTPKKDTVGGGGTAKEGEQPVSPLLAAVRKKTMEKKAAPDAGANAKPPPNDEGETTDFAAKLRMFGGTPLKKTGKGSPGVVGSKSPVVWQAGRNDDKPKSNFAAVLKDAGTHLCHNPEPKKATASSEEEEMDRQEPPQTPDANKELFAEVDQHLALTGRSSLDSASAGGLTPGASPGANVAKLVKENQKLRKRRKELLALLSSTAQQFSSYEKVCSTKISALEERNRELERKASPTTTGAEDAIMVARSASAPNVTHENGEGVQYGEDIVRRLSSGVLMQEKQLKTKDELISQLKLRCEVLKQNLADKDGEMAEEKKLWEEERSQRGTTPEGDSPAKEGQGEEVLEGKMKVARMKKELESALGDITMLTSALERNNETLDATVLELDKLKRWKAQHGGAATSMATAPDTDRTSDDSKKLREELTEKDNETSQLLKDLENSLNEIEELKKSVDAAAKAKGYSDFQDVVEGLKWLAETSKGEANAAKERIVELEAELAAKRGGEAGASATGDLVNRTAPATPKDTSANSVARTPAESPQSVEGQRMGLFGRLRAIGHSPMTEEETGDYRTMVRQRDLKIKSLEAMVHSNSRIVEKLRADIERMDNESEEAKFESTKRIEKLEEENRTYEMQVASFEKAFMNLNDERGGGAALNPSRETSDSIVDENMFMWDEEDGEQDEEPDPAEEASDLRAKNYELQRAVAESQANGSFQEDQIERLKADLVKLRVKSQQEKEHELQKLLDENEIILAQRSALENQLAEINKSARDTLSSPPATPQSPGGEDGGSDPILVAQLAMLERKNKVLESSVDSLRSDAQDKLAPLLTKIAELEQEKQMMQDEMQTKVDCREKTISSLEGSLKQLHKKASKKASRSTKMLKSKIAKNQSSSGEF